MNAEQKQRAKDALTNWLVDDMAALLQELVDAPEPEPVAYATGYYAGCLSIATVDGRVLPAGTALYAAPPAPSVPSVPVPDGWKHDCAGIMQNDVELWLDSCPHCGKPKTDSAPTPAEPPAELPTWENGDDPLVGGGLISRGVVDFASLGIWYGKPAPEAEPVAYFTGYNNGYPTIAPINSALCMAIGTALYSAPPAPSAPECLSTGGMTVWGDSVSIEKCNNFVHLASQAAGFKDELINTRAELADVARDAERYRWLLENARATAEHWGGRWSLVIDSPAPGKDASPEAINAAIDAAIEREILGGSEK